MKRSQHDRINQPGPNDQIFFYPKEFYVFDNFTSFQVKWKGILWPTSEHAFQAAKFLDIDQTIFRKIKNAKSAHDAQKIAIQYKDRRNKNWSKIKIEIMKDILRHKVNQHPYILRKLIESGDRIIIEDSWRDDEWGWGKDKDGENKLGKIWMEIRKEYLL